MFLVNYISRKRKNSKNLSFDEDEVSFIEDYVCETIDKVSLQKPKALKTVSAASQPWVSTPKSAGAITMSPEAKAVSAEYATFLNRRLDRSGMSDVSRQVKGLVDRVARLADLEEASSIDNVSAIVQEFYTGLFKRLKTHQLYSALTDEDRAKIIDLAEKYLTVCCYKQLFCPSVTNDEEKDLELQNRIRSLNWVSTDDLGCSIDETSQVVRDLLFESINDILEMDSKMAPQDKMASLVKCSKKIFDMLQNSNQAPASADDFLPCLIYICLKANPPRIQSNINFITRFCNEDKIRMGEGGYFFANLCCAMSFIENMTAQSVNMDPEEFDSYVSGRAVPKGSWRSSLLMCEGLQVMSQNLKALAELQERHDELLSNAKKLEAEMTAFQNDVTEEVSAVLDRTKYRILEPKQRLERTEEAVSRKVEADFESDDEDVIKASLPPPLLPQNVSVLVATLSQAADQEEHCKEEDLLEDYLTNSSACPSLAADNMSLLSIDVSKTTAADDDLEDVGEEENLQQLQTIDCRRPDDDDEVHHEESQPSSLTTVYHGFTAQSIAIPSISCDNTAARASMVPDRSNETRRTLGNPAEPDQEVTATNSASTTPSSPPLISVLTSPSTTTKTTTSSTSSISSPGPEGCPDQCATLDESRDASTAELGRERSTAALEPQGLDQPGQ